MSLAAPQVPAEKPARAASGQQSGARLLWVADAVLALVPQLRATGFVSDVARLRQTVAVMLRDLPERARRDGIDSTRIGQAIELLAALVDHTVTSMPWGADAGWQSLTSASPPEGAARGALSSGQRLLDVVRVSSSDGGMRELIQVALALGFDEASGDADEVQISQVRAELARKPEHAVPAELELSPHGQSSVERGSRLTGWLPLWVSSTVVAALLGVLYFGLELSLAAKSDGLYARMAAMNRHASPVPQRHAGAQPRLAAPLAAHIVAKRIAVSDEVDRSVIVVPAVQLFTGGSTQLQPAGVPLLRSIAAALQRTPGRIQVIGHTGGGAVRTARYPSDWDLSVDRARGVEEALRGAGIEPARMTYDGRAGIEPLSGEGQSDVDDDERVEIVLLAGR